MRGFQLQRASNGHRGQHGLRRTAAVAVCAAGLTISVIHTSFAAGSTSSSFRIGGRVLPRASVWVSQFTASLIGSSVLAGKYFSPRPLFVTDLHVGGNGGKYAVSLISSNATESGAPSLVDDETGTSVRYRLSYGGKDVRFVDGQAGLGKTDKLAADTPPQPLEIALPAGADLNKGKFQERLLLVVTAK